MTALSSTLLGTDLLAISRAPGAILGVYLLGIAPLPHPHVSIVFFSLLLRCHFAIFNSDASTESGSSPATFAISNVFCAEMPVCRAAINIMLTMLF